MDETQLETGYSAGIQLSLEQLMQTVHSRLACAVLPVQCGTQSVAVVQMDRLFWTGVKRIRLAMAE